MRRRCCRPASARWSAWWLGGHTYRAVAQELFISPKTVENHVRNIMAKLHLSRRHELIRWAVDRGIT